MGTLTQETVMFYIAFLLTIIAALKLCDKIQEYRNRKSLKPFHGFKHHYTILDILEETNDKP